LQDGAAHASEFFYLVLLVEAGSANEENFELLKSRERKTHHLDGISNQRTMIQRFLLHTRNRLSCTSCTQDIIGYGNGTAKNEI